MNKISTKGWNIKREQKNKSLSSSIISNVAKCKEIRNNTKSIQEMIRLHNEVLDDNDDDNNDISTKELSFFDLRKRI